MTAKLNQDLSELTRQMWEAHQSGDDEKFAELAPKRQQAVVQQVQYSLTGGVQ